MCILHIICMHIYMLGYIGIVFENFFEFNKAAISLLMCTALWIVYGDSVNSTPEVLHMLSEKVAEVSEVVFFILGKVFSVVIYAVHMVLSYSSIRLITC